MGRGLRVGGFEFQVRLVLVLLVLFLAALDVMSLHLFDRSRHSLERSERRWSEVQARQLVEDLGPETLPGLLTREQEIGSGTVTTLLRRAALRSGFARVALLDETGREVAGSEETAGDGRASGPGPPAEVRTALQAGGPVSLDPRPDPRSGETRIATYAPLLDSGGRLVGFLEAIAAVPDLGALDTGFRRVLTIQVAGVLAIGVLLLVFARWVSAPYRRIVAAAGEAGWPPTGRGESDDPDELVQAVRVMVAKLREQDEALTALGREQGGFGTLVGFARHAAARMSTGVLVLDGGGRVAAMNPSAAILLGCDEAETRGSDLRSLPRTVEGLHPLVRACLDTGRGASREVLEVRMGDVRAGHFGVAVAPVHDSDGHVGGVLVLLSDLTEIRELQEQVRLRESLAAVGQLSAGIAHEFRNALATILGYARILEKQGDPRARGPVAEIVREIDSVREVIDEFLLYARPPGPAREPVDLDRIVRRAAAGASEAIDVQVRGEFRSVIGDEGLLRRAFGDLLQNAADAGRDAGRRAQVLVSGRVDSASGSVWIDVDDDGPGIPPALRSQVFVPFFTTRAAGTGLGLALVQRTIVDLGGTVEAMGGPSGGARFRIRLPLFRAEDVSATGPAPSLTASPHRSERAEIGA